MKRYLLSYSQGVLMIRDRVTGQARRQSFVDADSADLIQAAVKKANYTVPKRKSKITKLTIDDCPELRQITTRFEYGWIQPKEIQWTQEEQEVDLHKELNNLLGLKE